MSYNASKDRGERPSLRVAVKRVDGRGGSGHFPAATANPLKYPSRSQFNRGVAQPGSASALGAEGRVFESHRPDHPSSEGYCGERNMRARIFEPAKSAMQSGKALTKKWLLEFEPETALEIDPLMGWTSSSDMRQQVQLQFDTCEEAVAYCKTHSI